MMLFTLLLTAWPIVVIAIVGLALGFFLIKGIKYLNKKNTEKNND